MLPISQLFKEILTTFLKFLFKKCIGCPVFAAHLALILKVYNTYVREMIMIRGVRRNSKGGANIDKNEVFVKSLTKRPKGGGGKTLPTLCANDYNTPCC